MTVYFREEEIENWIAVREVKTSEENISMGWKKECANSVTSILPYSATGCCALELPTLIIVFHIVLIPINSQEKMTGSKWVQKSIFFFCQRLAHRYTNTQVYWAEKNSYTEFGRRKLTASCSVSLMRKTHSINWKIHSGFGFFLFFIFIYKLSLRGLTDNL